MNVIVTTGNDVIGHTIASYIGIVRGIVVRSPSISQGFMGGLKQMVGGNVESLQANANAGTAQACSGLRLSGAAGRRCCCRDG